MPVHSRVVQIHCHDIVKDAVSILSTKGRNGHIPLVLIPSARPAGSIMMQVPTGVYCLMQKYGKDVGLAKPGLNLLPAFYRIAYVVSKQACTYDAPVRACPTSDNVRINIDVVVIFQIVDPKQFVFKLGVSNFDEFLSGTVDEGIRMLVREEDHRSVIALRGEKADVLIRTLNHKMLPFGVKFLDVKVTSVEQPTTLYHNLEATTKMDKAMEKLDRQNEFEILKIRQESEMQIEEIKRKGEQVLVSESGRKKHAELTFEQRSVKAEEDGRVALIEAEAKVEVMKLEADTQLNRTKTQLETWRATQIAQAEAQSNSTRVKADLSSEGTLIRAGWEEEEMVCDAQATKHDASAEKEGSKSLQSKRKHALEMREKEILMKLAATGNFNLVGANGDKLLQSMMSGTLQS